MSFTPVFEISKVSPTSFIFKDVTPISDTGYGATGNPVDSTGIAVVQISAHSYDFDVNLSVYDGTIDPTTPIQPNLSTGLKVNMNVPDGVVEFKARYSGDGITFAEATKLVLVTAKADLCIFAAIETVSLYTQCDFAYVNKTMYKILLKQIAQVNFDRGNYTKADEAARLICGTQSFTTSNCNCD